IQTGCAAPTSEDVPAPDTTSELTASEYTVLTPEKGQGTLEIEIVNKLQGSHYNKVKLDNDFSNKLFNAYLNDLDPTHSVFLESDINHLRKKYADVLDEQLVNGQLSAAFAIFNIFQKRRIEIDNWVLQRLKQGIGTLNLKNQDSLKVDRENTPWPSDDD